MGEKKWFENYCGQTIDELITLQSEYRVDSLNFAIEDALTKKEELLGDEELSFEENVFLIIMELDREVSSGGYHQFFVNSAPFVASTVQALEAIGCVKTARITKSAIRALGVKGTIARGKIESRVLGTGVDNALLANCNNEFFKYEEDIDLNLFEFAKRNSIKFDLTAMLQSTS